MVSALATRTLLGLEFVLGWDLSSHSAFPRRGSSPGLTAGLVPAAQSGGEGLFLLSGLSLGGTNCLPACVMPEMCVYRPGWVVV